MVRTLQAAGKIRGIGARGVVALTAAVGIGLSALPAAAAEPASQRQSPPNWIKASLWALDNSVPVVVFGARLNEDCSAPDVLGQRLNLAATFAKLHPRTTIIVTGGHTRAGCPAESSAMRTGLQMRGVKNPIIEESRAHTTLENAKYVSEMWPGARMIVATSADHADRASANLRSHGKDTVSLS